MGLAALALTWCLAQLAAPWLQAAWQQLRALCAATPAPATLPAQPFASWQPGGHALAPFASIANSAAPQAQHSWSTVALYKLQKLFSKNIISKILAVVVLATPLVVVSGFLYARATGGSLRNSMFHTYTVLQDTPGADACNEESRLATWVVNMTHIIGLFTYALVLGIVSDDVQRLVEGFKTGNNPICEAGHTVVLNSNPTTPSLLRQWAKAQGERGTTGTIVLLADQPKEDLDEVVDTLKAETGLDIVARSGLPYSLDDLDLVGAAQAATIIIMDPNHHVHEQDTAKVQPFAATLVSLAALGADDARFVVQLPEEGMVAAAAHERDTLTSACRLHLDGDGRHRVVEVDALKALSDAKVQCTVSPGLSQFYKSVFSHHSESPEVYCGQFKQLTGKTFGEARKLFRGSTLLGVLNSSGVVHACPSDSVVITEADTVFGLAYNQNDLKAARMGPTDTRSEWVRPAKVPDVRARNIIVAAFGAPNFETLRTLGATMPRGGTMTVVSERKLDIPRGHYDVRWVRGHPSSAAVLMKAGMARADSLLVAGIDQWDDTEADMQIMSTFAQMADLCALTERSRPLHIVAEARGPLLADFTERLQQRRASVASGTASSTGEAARLLTSDVLPTEELAAGFIAQCGMQPKLSTILKELFDVEGARMVTRHPLSYMKADETVTVQDLEDRSRKYGEIIVGYLDHSLEGTFMLNKTQKVNYEDVKELIVMTTDVAYKTKN